MPAPLPRASTDWKVVVGTTDLSAWAFDVQIDDTRNQLDASGFNPSNASTYIPGLKEQTVTVSFRADWQASGPNQTISALYSSGTTFKFYVLGDSDTGTSAANPLYGGTASCYSFPVGATLNEVENLEIAFRPASGSVFNWGTVAP
jgi:hypothetical protein